MTCMKQEFCIHEKYCQRHIGQNFDSCILFSRNSKPQTNEEWLRTATTEQLAEFVVKAMILYDNSTMTVLEAIKNAMKNDVKLSNYFMESLLEWLKQPHREENEK